MTYKQMLAIPVKHRMTGMVVHTDRGLYQLQNKVDNTAWVLLNSNTTTCTINESFVMNAELYKGLQKLSLGYLARIIDGKLVRVARVTPCGVDYNFENN